MVTGHRCKALQPSLTYNLKNYYLVLPPESILLIRCGCSCDPELNGANCHYKGTFSNKQLMFFLETNLSQSGNVKVEVGLCKQSSE